MNAALALAERALRAPIARALLALCVVLAVGAVFHREGAFYQWATHRGMLREIATTGMLACGMTLVIVGGGIDLSVGSVMALGAVSFATATMHWGLSAGAALVLVIGAGAALGAINGLLVDRFSIQPFIVTLAMMVFARGLAKLASGGQKVTNYVEGADGSMTTVELPPVFELLDTDVLLGAVSAVTLVFVGCVVLTFIVLHRLRAGRYLFAVGANPEAARLSGVPVARVTVLAYLLSGVFAGLAGICQAAQETQGDPETGLGYELDAIAMVVIGGTALSGGRGGVGQTVVGALTLGYLQKILSINAFSIEVRLMLTGVIIVCAVLFQRRRG